MKDKKWFQKDLFRILVDMHIPDWDETRKSGQVICM